MSVRFYRFPCPNPPIERGGESALDRAKRIAKALAQGRITRRQAVEMQLGDPVLIEREMKRLYAEDEEQKRLLGASRHRREPPKMIRKNNAFIRK